MNVEKIGTVAQKGGLFTIRLGDEYRAGLRSIEGFSLLKILWWADKSEGCDYQGDVVIDKPYTKGPEKVGVFATRSQFRPNPICETVIRVASVDPEEGVISTYYIDAFPGTAVLDIKPYLPSTDVSRDVSVPAWCSHWPSSMEDAGDFNWDAEFNFSD